MAPLPALPNPPPFPPPRKRRRRGPKPQPPQPPQPSSRRRLLEAENGSGKGESVNIFLASRFADEHVGYLKDLYSAYPSERGEVVSVQHINSERDEKTDDGHTERAFCEMWLLGFAQNLITSANSTFSFVAQGLGSHRPWALNFRQINPPFTPCTRRPSAEPCHLNASYTYDCGIFDKVGKREQQDLASLVPYVKRCWDRRVSLVLVPPDEEHPL